VFILSRLEADCYLLVFDFFHVIHETMSSTISMFRPFHNQSHSNDTIMILFTEHLYFNQINL